MANDFFITQFVRVVQHQAQNNQRVVFEHQSVSLDSFLADWYHQLGSNYPKFFKMDRQSKLGFLATEVLLDQRQLAHEYSSESVGIILSNAQASLDTDQRYFETTKTFASPGLFVYTLPNIVAGEISIRHHLKGETAFFVSPSFDAEWMASYVSLVMANPTTQACIAGWVDIKDQQADVLLYLTEKKKESGSIVHNTTTLDQLYKKGLWKS
jgi:hypothetical protein